MLMEMSGEEDDLDKGIGFLKEHDVTVKLYTENLIHYEEQCVHCGACTAVCPSKALTMNQDTWELEFDMEECLMCGHCVRACPTRAIKLSEEL
jgi:formate hydrogenlyase subunit 6/NADH:ubiquinone oxidoreductase subunit I